MNLKIFQNTLFAIFAILGVSIIFWASIEDDRISKSKTGKYYHGLFLDGRLPFQFYVKAADRLKENQFYREALIILAAVPKDHSDYKRAQENITIVIQKATEHSLGK